MAELKLGDHVTVKAEAVATKTTVEGDRGYHIPFRGWLRHEYKEPKNGIVVGVRAVKEGKSVWLGEDEGYAFEPTQHLQVYLIAINMRQFIRAFPDDVEVTVDG